MQLAVPAAASPKRHAVSGAGRRI
eukprot:SAG22_NODE_15944_length_336_cov_0.864979_1_plen_23_part_01